MSSEFTFVVEKTCPVCGKSVKVVKVKSRLAAFRMDDDYCCHYTEMNPYLYYIWVCDGCGFAADERVFLAPLSKEKKELLKNAFDNKPVHFKFDVNRTVPDGVASLKLAIFCAKVMKSPLARIAGLELRLAWIYRLADQLEDEEKAEQEALELYKRSLATEHFPIGNMTDTMVAYLIGAINVRLGNYKQAVQYLSSIVDENNTLGDSRVARDARRLWQEVRDKSKDEEKKDKPNTNKAAASHSASKAKEKSKAKPAAKSKKKSGLGKWF